MKATLLRVILFVVVIFTAAGTAPVASAHDVWLTTAGPASARRVIVNGSLQRNVRVQDAGGATRQTLMASNVPSDKHL